MLGWIGLAGLALLGATKQTAAQKKAAAAAKKAAAIQKQITAAQSKGNTAAVNRLSTQLNKIAPAAAAAMKTRDITNPVTDANGTVCDASQIDPNTNLCMVGAPQAGGLPGASALTATQQKKIVANANKMIKQISAKMNDLNTYAQQGRIDPNIAQQYAAYLQCLQQQVVNVATQCQAPGTTVAQLTQMINKAKQAVKKGTPPTFAPGGLTPQGQLDANGQPCPPGTAPDVNGVCQPINAIAPPGGVDTTTPTDGLVVTGPQGTFEAGSPIDGGQDTGIIYEDPGVAGGQYIQSPYQNEVLGPSAPTPSINAPYPGYGGMPNTQLPWQGAPASTYYPPVNSLQPLSTDTKACTNAKNAYNKQMTNLQNRLTKAQATGKTTQINNIIKQINTAQTRLMTAINTKCVTPGAVAPGYPNAPGYVPPYVAPPSYPGTYVGQTVNLSGESFVWNGSTWTTSGVGAGGYGCGYAQAVPPVAPGTYSGQTVYVNNPNYSALNPSCGGPQLTYTWNGYSWQQTGGGATGYPGYPGTSGPLQVGSPCASTTGAQGWFDGYTCKTIDQIPDAVPGFTQAGQLARKNVGYSAASSNQYGIPPTYFSGAYYVVGVWNGSDVVPVGAGSQPGSCPPGFAFNGYQCNPIGGGTYATGYGAGAGGGGGSGYADPVIYSDDGSAAGLDTGALVVTGGGPTDDGGGDIFDDSGVAFNQGDAAPGQAILGPVRAPMEQAVIAQANRVTPPSTESTDILDTSTASTDASKQYPGVGDDSSDDFASTNDLDDVSGGDSGAGGDLTITDWSDTDSRSDDDFGFAGLGRNQRMGRRQRPGAQQPPRPRHFGYFGAPAHKGRRIRPAGTVQRPKGPHLRAHRTPGARRNRLLKGLPLIAMY